MDRCICCGRELDYEGTLVCWYCILFDIVSGVDLDLYDDECNYKDEWGVLAEYKGIEFSEISINTYLCSELITVMLKH